MAAGHGSSARAGSDTIFLHCNGFGEAPKAISSEDFHVRAGPGANFLEWDGFGEVPKAISV